MSIVEYNHKKLINLGTYRTIWELICFIEDIKVCRILNGLSKFRIDILNLRFLFKQGFKIVISINNTCNWVLPMILSYLHIPQKQSMLTHTHSGFKQINENLASQHPIIYPKTQHCWWSKVPIDASALETKIIIRIMTIEKRRVKPLWVYHRRHWKH
jgi:hypothetical protein